MYYKIFNDFKIESARETVLGANQFKEENERLKWKSESNEVNENESD